MKWDPELHITVVALTPGQGLEMRDELSLVKAALLYADRVTLASPRAALFDSVRRFPDATRAERKRLLLQLTSILPQGLLLVSHMEALRRKKPKSRDDLIRLAQMEALVDETTRDLDAKTMEMLNSSGFVELERARAAGVLDLDPLGTDMNSAFIGSVSAAALGPSGQFKEQAKATVKLIESVLGQGSNTFPLFSEVTRGLARAMVAEGRIEGADLAPTTHAGVAGRFISTVEAFPDASMDTILDARGRLVGPLRQFRAGVTRVSRELGDVDALDPKFQRAANDLYREHVSPALADINELSRELGLLTALRRETPTVARDVGAALPFIALAATSGQGVETLVSAAAGVTGATLDLAGRTAIRRRRLRTQRDRNEFVFLYDVDKRLTGKGR